MKKVKSYLQSSRAILIVIVPCILVLTIFACATNRHVDAFNEVDQKVMRHDFGAALAAIAKGQEGRPPLYPENNAISLFLDTGFLRHFNGDYVASSSDLLEAERLISEAFTRSVTADFLVWLGNDNAREYAGEDFEDIYLSIFNALNFFHKGDFEGAMVEIRKLTMDPGGKLPMLNLKFENARQGFATSVMEVFARLGLSLNDALPAGINPANFSDSALARYLSILFYTANGDMDSARIEYERLQTAFESNRQIYHHPIPSSVAELKNVPYGQGRLNIIGFTGLSPVKREEWFSGRFPFLSNPELQTPAFRLPIMVDRPSAIDRIGVAVYGQSGFNLEIIEDMGAVVRETFNARFADMFFRTYIRVLMRYIAADIAVTQAGRGGGLARTAAAIAARATADALEGADTRMSRFLPNKASVGGINLYPGSYRIRVNFYSGNRVIYYETHTVEINAGSFNLLQVVNLR